MPAVSWFLMRPCRHLLIKTVLCYNLDMNEKAREIFRRLGIYEHLGMVFHSLRSMRNRHLWQELKYSFGPAPDNWPIPPSQPDFPGCWPWLAGNILAIGQADCRTNGTAAQANRHSHCRFHSSSRSRLRLRTAAAPPSGFDPCRIAWLRLQFTAHRLVSASFAIRPIQAEFAAAAIALSGSFL